MKLPQAIARIGTASAKGGGSRPAGSRGFTLIELILVMTILTVTVSITAPALARFFRGRSLDSEARRLLALTRQGQSRAISEGLPMDLWIDSNNRAIGLEAEPSYETDDPKAVQFEVDPDMQIEAVTQSDQASSFGSTRMSQPTSSLTTPLLRKRPNLPTIRFLPDGSMAESSPQTVRITGRDGTALWLVQSRNHLSYEIQALSK